MGTDLPFYLNAITRQQFLCMVQLCGTICHSVGGKSLKVLKSHVLCGKLLTLVMGFELLLLI